jgi:hypothetical protein
MIPILKPVLPVERQSPERLVKAEAANRVAYARRGRLRACPFPPLQSTIDTLPRRSCAYESSHGVSHSYFTRHKRPLSPTVCLSWSRDGRQQRSGLVSRVASARTGPAVPPGIASARTRSHHGDRLSAPWPQVEHADLRSVREGAERGRQPLDGACDERDLALQSCHQQFLA